MKTCDHCKTKFNNKNKKFCSVNCHLDSMKSTPSKYPLSRTCDHCGKTFQINSSSELPKRFCNRSCSSSYNNMKFPKKAPERVCKGCPNLITNNRTFCQGCQPAGVPGWDVKSKIKVRDWLSGKWDGATPLGALSKTIRNYLIQEANNYCQSSTCPLEGKQVPTHPIDEASILEVDHINGNGEDHRPDNLRVICPTCHALTTTYRGRNVGNGRKVYYHRRSYPSAEL